MTTWQLVTHVLARILSFGMCHGRCFVCGSWLFLEMVAPGCSGTICRICEQRVGLEIKVQKKLDRIFGEESQ